MKRRPLGDDQISRALEALPGWSWNQDQLHRSYVLRNFRDVVSFVTRIAFEAEAANHHPSLALGYNTVQVVICTHDAGNVVTQMDVELAHAIEGCFARYSTS